jgi:hypothetical protein
MLCCATWTWDQCTLEVNLGNEDVLIPGPEQIHLALGVLDVSESTYQDLGSVNRLSPVRTLNNCHRASLKIMLLAGQVIQQSCYKVKSLAKILERLEAQASSRKLQA